MTDLIKRLRDKKRLRATHGICGWVQANSAATVLDDEGEVMTMPPLLAPATPAPHPPQREG